jgi:hypothetical protein
VTREPRPRNPRSGRGEAVCGSLPPEFPLEPWLPLVELASVEPVDPVDPPGEPDAEPLWSEEDVPEDDPIEEDDPLD